MICGFCNVHNISGLGDSCNQSFTAMIKASGKDAKVFLDVSWEAHADEETKTLNIAADINDETDFALLKSQLPECAWDSTAFEGIRCFVKLLSNKSTWGHNLGKRTNQAARPGVVHHH